MELIERSNGERVYRVPVAELVSALKMQAGTTFLAANLVVSGELADGVLVLHVTPAPVTETKSNVDPATGVKTVIVDAIVAPKG